MGYYVKVGASIPEGLESVRAFKKLKLGNFILTSLPLNKQEAINVCNFCRKNKIYFIFSEFLYRGTNQLYWPARKKIKRNQFYDKKTLEKFFETGGKYFLGRITLGEAGGMLYWPKKYLIRRKAGAYSNLRVAKNLIEAKKFYLEYLKKVINLEKNLGESKLLNVDSSFVFKYHLEAGIDIPLLEAMPGDSNLMYAAIRSAAKTYHKKEWGSHIAMACYGGVKIDNFWFKRWKISLYYAFLNGATFVYQESGHFNYNQQGENYGFYSFATKKMREILREFNQFCQIHSRPSNGPKVKIGFVYGNLDGFPGLWNKYVWGQFKGKKWLHGPPEWGWDYLNNVYHKEEWFNSYIKGETDYSGNPPNGLYDIVPVEASLNILQKYGCLIFVGWNTMTNEIYQKLKDYVRGGGHLFMALPHLNTSIERNRELKLYRNGDYRDLFGVIVNGKGKKEVTGIKYYNHSSIKSYKFPVWRINTDPRFIGEITKAKVKIVSAKVLAGYSDFYYQNTAELSNNPFLTENSFGKGKVFLINTWSYPGEKGMELFMNNLLKIIYDGEQEDIRIIGSEKIRYSIYEEKNLKIIYLLNTEFDCPHIINLWIKDKIFPSLEISPAEMRVIYYNHNLIVAPENRFIDLKFWKLNKNYQQIEFFNLKDQKLVLCNLNFNKQNVEINGKKIIIEPEKKYNLTIKRKVNPLRKEFFNLNFLKEPTLKWKFGGGPY